MGERHADQGYRKFWTLMKEMSWKERLQHIIYYYGVFILIGGILLYMLGDSLYDMLQPEPDQILVGTAVNVHVSVDMEKRLTEDAFAYVGGVDTAEQETLLVANKVRPGDLSMISVLQTKMLTGEYHYALLDQTGLEMLLSMQALPSLYDVLPKEKWEPWSDRFVSVQTDGETYPVAIDIGGTPLAAGCTFEGDRIYIAFPVNVDTLAVIEPFLEYLISGGLLTTP